MRQLIADDLGQHAGIAVDDRREQNKSLTVSIETRLTDIFNTCCDNNSQIHSLAQAVKTLSAETMILREEMRELKGTIRRTEAVIGSRIYGEDRVGLTSHSKDANNTRKVSNDVVAAVIRSIWHNNMGGQMCLPVDMKYLSKLCDVRSFGKPCKCIHKSQLGCWKSSLDQSFESITATNGRSNE